MKSIFIFLTGCCLVAGCAQPKPADCKGDFRPVNAKPSNAKSSDDKSSDDKSSDDKSSDDKSSDDKPMNANQGKTRAIKISCLSGAKHG